MKSNHSMRPVNNVINRAVRTREADPVVRRFVKPINVPFSLRGIVAVLACPAMLLLDVFFHSHILFGVIFLITMTLLGNERRTLIALFVSVAVITLVIDLRLIYDQPNADLAITDKLLAMAALPLLAVGMIRDRTRTLKAAKRKAAIKISFAPILTERLAMHGETKTAFQHIRRSHEIMDGYTRELIWFVYVKSPKN